MLSLEWSLPLGILVSRLLFGKLFLISLVSSFLFNEAIELINLLFWREAFLGKVSWLLAVEASDSRLVTRRGLAVANRRRGSLSGAQRERNRGCGPARGRGCKGNGAREGS